MIFGINQSSGEFNAADLLLLVGFALCLWELNFVCNLQLDWFWRTITCMWYLAGLGIAFKLGVVAVIHFDADSLLIIYVLWLFFTIAYMIGLKELEVSRQRVVTKEQ